MRFHETQELKRHWIWSLLIVILLVPTGIVLSDYHPLSIAIMLPVSALIPLLLKTMRLTTIIDEYGITYKFHPFHLQFRKIPWMLIERCEVRTYHPLAEYRGWGVKLGRSGKAYSVAGNKGLQLYLKTGKKLLIGTQKEKELRAYLRMIGKI